MLAVAEIKGKQYIVKSGDVILVDKLNVNEGEIVEFDKVLLTSGESVSLGMPYLAASTIKAKVLGDTRSDKVVVYKMKAKKRFQKNKSHRQTYTKIEIVEITSGGNTVKAEATTKKKSTPKPTEESKKKAEAKPTAKTVKKTVKKSTPSEK